VSAHPIILGCLSFLMLTIGNVACRPSAPRESAVGMFYQDAFTTAGAVEFLPSRRSPNTCSKSGKPKAESRNQDNWRTGHYFGFRLSIFLTASFPSGRHRVSPRGARCFLFGR
jgi:hypothetical protein